MINSLEIFKTYGNLRGMHEDGYPGINYSVLYKFLSILHSRKRESEVTRKVSSNVLQRNGVKVSTANTLLGRSLT